MHTGKPSSAFVFPQGDPVFLLNVSEKVLKGREVHFANFNLAALTGSLISLNFLNSKVVR